jgi:hypothetical protein
VRKFGSAIIPVVEGGKAPAIEGGYKAASKDWKRLEAIFRPNPRLNCGIATGAVSGFFAVDIDGLKGRATIAALVRKHGPLPKMSIGVELCPLNGVGPLGWAIVRRLI